MAIDYALSLAKPDAMRRSLVGKIISRFENKGLTLIDLTVTYATTAMIEAMYADKKDEADFPALLEYMLSGPIVAMLWQGEEANKALRLVVGAKDPLESPPGSLRGDYAGDPVKTLVHGSRNPEEAYAEALIWFPERFDAAPLGESKDLSDAGSSLGPPIGLIDVLALPLFREQAVTANAAFESLILADLAFDSSNLTILKAFEPVVES